MEGAPRQAAEEGDQEAEGGRKVGVVRGGDFVHGAACEAALREMIIEGWEAERQTVCAVAREALHTGEAAAEIGDDLGASGLRCWRLG